MLACRYEKNGPLRGTGAPVVGVLLYRKHVITEQPYIMQLISQMEEVGGAGSGAGVGGRVIVVFVSIGQSRTGLYAGCIL